MLNRPNPIDLIENRYSPFVRIEDVVKDYLEKQPWMKAEKITGLPSGITGLDQVTDGFQPGEIVVVSGSSDIFLQNVALNVASSERKPVAYFSLTTKGFPLASCLIAKIAGIDQGRIRTGHMSEKQKERLKKVQEKFIDVPLYINDNNGQSVYDIQRHIQNHLMKKLGTKPALIIIDCLQMIVPWGKDVSRKNQIDHILSELEDFAHSTAIPIAIGSLCYPASPARGFDNGPQLTDLIAHPETALIDNYADKVFFVYRENLDDLIEEYGNSYGGPDYPSGSQLKLSVTKNPNGVFASIVL